MANGSGQVSMIEKRLANEQESRSSVGARALSNESVLSMIKLPPASRGASMQENLEAQDMR